MKDNLKQKAYDSDKKETCNTSRALSNGRGWRNIGKKKIFSVRFLPHFDREHFRGITRTSHLCGPIEISQIPRLNFRESYRIREFLSVFFYLVAHYRRIRLLHPPVIVFFSFRFRRKPLNRARWHNSRSRHSPTCYHRRRQRIVKPADRAPVTRYVAHRAVVFTCENRATRSARWIGAIGDLHRIVRIFFQFLQCDTLIKKMKIFLIAN